ncbi:MAG TPA: sulfur carrier protein ThiS adenylyltransferase ThiF [Spirochaetia bacterium]|nr:sulfur carrier protein ThiS adenylyltransferase ThiF [Spirochaetales bacterium]HRS66087.1 sulfur carrier protein ThiS adenylyltransferase ThiF [Spirochaetia bacterium]HOT60236.1 sulfur carrier protein ThiS adenylyltransferase ThiF [Spirochaetales bacterium]HPD79874.1 sulfur carrier protein ThiS adenylyltransferase ThiF [Spirochaetales bacterium]HQK33271.1 sulfur carrier protein ThiS adenylyltransferase ThiF [Spirochaetales bacterium]
MDRETIRTILSHFTVGIGGAGGLGSNCAVALARSNIGTLIIVDFDTVSEANLDRQYFFLPQVGQPKVAALKDTINTINPNVTVQPFIERVTRDSIARLFASCDIIVEAFDSAETKLMFLETCMQLFPEKPLITATGLAGYGNSTGMKVRTSGNLIIIGDESAEVSPDNPPLAPRVGIAAAMQANEAIAKLVEIYSNEETYAHRIK